MGLRPAEIGEHAVAHELRDMALEAPDLARYSVLIGADHLAHVLGIELRRQRGRPHQIAEHHRQLPSLGFGVTCFIATGGRPGRQFSLRMTQGLYRPQEDLTVTQ
jgi:hypothetical protein